MSAKAKIKRIIFRNPWIVSLFNASLFALPAVLPNYFIDKSTKIFIVIISIIVCILLFFTGEKVKKWSKNDYNLLKHIQNICLRQKINIKLVSQHMDDGSEKKLEFGSEMHLLTNDIKNYDLTSAAIDVISRNIMNSIRYIYYVPDTVELKKDFDKLKAELFNKIVEKIAPVSNYYIETRQQIAKQQIEKFLVINYIDNEDELLYNFSYVISPSKKVEASWYVSDQNSDAPVNGQKMDDNQVLLVWLGKNEENELMKIVKSLANRFELRFDGKESLLFR